VRGARRIPDGKVRPETAGFTGAADAVDPGAGDAWPPESAAFG